MKTPFKFVRVELCGNCHGSGTVEEGTFRRKSYTCPTCEGSGRVVKTREGIVTIEPYREGN